MTIKEILQASLERENEFWLKGNNECLVKTLSVNAEKIKLKIIKPYQEVIYATGYIDNGLIKDYDFEVQYSIDEPNTIIDAIENYPDEKRVDATFEGFFNQEKIYGKYVMFMFEIFK